MSNALDLSMGVTLMGCLLSSVLYGITVTQTYLYFQRYPRDHRGIKTMVAVLWILDTFHLALISHSIYFYLVSNFSNPKALASTIWSFNVEVCINGIIGLIVECYFARRLLRLSGGSTVGWSLTIIVVCLSLIHFILGIFFTDRLFEIVVFSNMPQLTWITKVGLGSAAACDLLICLSLCWYLYNSRTGFKRTDSLITTLMVYTLNCGLLTGLCAAVVVIMFSVLPNTLIFMAFFWILGKLYCNSCIAMLNSREALRGKVGLETDHPSSRLSASTRRGRRGSYLTSQDRDFEISYARPKSPQPALTIRVDTTTETLREQRDDASGKWTKSSLRSPPHYCNDAEVMSVSPADSSAPLMPEKDKGWAKHGYNFRF